MVKTTFLASLAAVFALLLTSSARAQRTLPSQKVTVPPAIDGNVEPEEWKSVPKVDGGFDENNGAPAPLSQQFWFGYDDRFIYFAAKLEDREPSKILATETRMNVNIQSEDHVIIAVDPFNNLQNLNQFRINPLGATQLQIAGGRAPKREWVGEILARGRTTADGWECEARIPWAIMQLPSPGVRNVRVDFGRYFQRGNRAYIASNIAGGQEQNILQWSGVEIPKVTQRKVLKLLPYGYAGASDSENETFANGGLDLKTSLSEGLELVGTFKPDFRNIENNVLSLDFSYFERLAGESRPFFIEGQEFFRTSMDASLFASQRIRDFDTGLKLYGKLNDQTRIALLQTVDFDHDKASVGSVSYQLGLRESLLLAGTHLDRPGEDNSAGFLSYSRGFGSFNYFGQWSTTTDDRVDGGHRYNTGLTYEKVGLNGFFEYQEISPEYLPRLGFAPEVGYKGWAGNLEWQKPHRNRQLMETEVSIGGRYQDDFDGKPFRRRVEGSLSLTGTDQTDLDLGAQYEEIQGFKDRLFFVSLEKPRGNPNRRWQVDYAWGRVAGHELRLFSPFFAYRPTKQFQLTLRHQDLHHIDSGQQTILGMNYELNRFDSFSGRILRRDDDVNLYLAWRRAGNRGIEYYVILGDPNARKFETALVIKAVVPIEVILGK